MTFDPRVALAARCLGAGTRVTEVAGDASTRRFFRATGPKGTAILMDHGEPLPSDAPFFSNHRVLQEIGAPVPQVLDRDDPHGLVLVEDFGDVTLQRVVLSGAAVSDATAEPVAGGRVASSPDSAAGVPYLYDQACDLIALMQREAAGRLRPDDFAARHALDRERFLFEMNHFERHFIRALRGIEPTDSEAALLRTFFETLAGDCDALPRVYCHRDFQSRNLMVRDAGSGSGVRDAGSGSGGRLGLIDFQDARMGPYTYDAASLLRDSSVDLDPSLVGRLLTRLAASCALPLGIGPEEFLADFDLMALERNIKDLGTFGFLATSRGRTDYLDYVPRTIAFVRRTLFAYRRWHPFAPLLDRLILDWRP